MIALVITLIFCLWRGAILWDVICAWQIGTSMLLLFFTPVLTFYYGN
ncbi:putative membrane protein [Raoultella ornithinolytica 2-156-04_S1_C2]|nr:putative membrane protein [Raoultella ornithinolytica 2-156-04_S1_C1]KDX16321.1 putative membrane protein [Raoultella ornithinolytica 2-156-04_S1_C2]